MRRGFARVKWQARKIRKDLSSSQDLGERRMVVEGFLPGSACFLRNLGRARIPS